MCTSTSLNAPRITLEVYFSKLSCLGCTIMLVICYILFQCSYFKNTGAKLTLFIFNICWNKMADNVNRNIPENIGYNQMEPKSIFISSLAVIYSVQIPLITLKDVRLAYVARSESVLSLMSVIVALPKGTIWNPWSSCLPTMLYSTCSNFLIF